MRECAVASASHARLQRLPVRNCICIPCSVATASRVFCNGFLCAIAFASRVQLHPYPVHICIRMPRAVASAARARLHWPLVSNCIYILCFQSHLHPCHVCICIHAQPLLHPVRSCIDPLCTFAFAPRAQLHLHAVCSCICFPAPLHQPFVRNCTCILCVFSVCGVP